jgi:hypothetical protein
VYDSANKNYLLLSVAEIFQQQENCTKPNGVWQVEKCVSWWCLCFLFLKHYDADFSGLTVTLLGF